MSFMDLYTTSKGALYSCDCAKCGATLYTHEYANDEHNERRDAMQSGTLQCEHCCIGTADAETFHDCGHQYAGRYSADGYMDCTDWEFDTNLRRLERSLRQQYGD